jgi:hypothetical protein
MFVLRMCNTTPCYAQLTAPSPLTDSGYWVSKSDMVAVMNGVHRKDDTIRYLRGRELIYRHVIDSFQAQVRDLSARVEYNATMFKLSTQIIDRDNQVQESYKQENNDLKDALNSWTRSPILWIVVGAGLYHLISKSK